MILMAEGESSENIRIMVDNGRNGIYFNRPPIPEDFRRYLGRIQDEYALALVDFFNVFDEKFSRSDFRSSKRMLEAITTELVKEMSDIESMGQIDSTRKKSIGDALARMTKIVLALSATRGDAQSSLAPLIPFANLFNESIEEMVADNA